MAINAEEIEVRLKEAINPLVGTRITKEVLAEVLKRVTNDIAKEHAPPSEIKVTSMDENGKIAFELSPDLSRILRENLRRKSPD